MGRLIYSAISSLDGYIEDAGARFDCTSWVLFATLSRRRDSTVCESVQ